MKVPVGGCDVVLMNASNYITGITLILIHFFKYKFFILKFIKKVIRENTNKTPKGMDIDKV